MQATEFDIIVIGTGIGGAVAGYSLSKSGRSVLFLEQGRDLTRPGVVRGIPAEGQQGFPRASGEAQRDFLKRAGRNPEPYLDGRKGDEFVPFIGHGTGGSSALYGMVFERRLPHDFEGWPIGYSELSPWYQRAEELFEVSGSRDPLQGESAGAQLRTPPPLSPAYESLFGYLEGRGYHPYRLHLASRRVPDCRMCQGFLCDSDNGCKRDALTACLAPALAQGNSQLIAEAQVKGLDRSGRKLTAVHATVKGEEKRYRAKFVVLGAGALATPRLLLGSGNLANSSGLVGRRLMRHAIDLFVLSLSQRLSHPSESKELAMNDFYSGTNWLGTVQSFGVAPPLAYLRNLPERNLWNLLGPAAVPVSKLFASKPIVAGILEDQPDPENRIEVRGDRAVLYYRLPRTDEKRRARFRRAMMRAFAKLGPIPVMGTSDRKAIGHVCGTSRFGEDPKTSVLDANNRAHDLDNLYVVDASFFPTSGGVNPALTIAANALRVADHLERLL